MWKELPGDLPASSTPANGSTLPEHTRPPDQGYHGAGPGELSVEDNFFQVTQSSLRKHLLFPMRHRCYFNATLYPNHKPNLNKVLTESKPTIFKYFRQFNQTLQLSLQ